MAQVTDPEEARRMHQTNLEWTPETTETLLNTIRNYPNSFGGEGAVLGDILDSTPKDFVSKVMLEEKLFDTWYDGNIVLIGDGELTVDLFLYRSLFVRLSLFVIVVLFVFCPGSVVYLDKEADSRCSFISYFLSSPIRHSLPQGKEKEEEKH